ncbi:hypothetical protein GH714_037086 [Hevea brasiliensis]|uniref:Uncharacterized protein n=1 Tax=Hevea brasiliensis TaxID=3981 RepID=A0A6A6KFV1_HEVBR|nr:hypothetical protein GH714_037086 [Hevea brasiliensis]
MDSTQGSTLSANMANLIDGTPTRRQFSYMDSMPVYVKELIAGGAAGGFAKTAVAPLERTKILLQVKLPSDFRKLCGFYVNGFRPVIDLLAGSVAGGTAVMCTYPLDLARTKLAYQVLDTSGSFRCGMKNVCAQPAYGGVKDILTSVYKEGGTRALYRGVGPTLIGILPYAGLKFYVYEELKRHIPEEHQKSIVMRLSCGALAGLFGQTFTYPLDVVRRQMQVENLQPSIQGHVKYRSTLDGLSTIVRNQGWRQLYAGLSINYIKIVPSVAIGFTAYDMMKIWLRIPPRQKSQSVSTG